MCQWKVVNDEVTKLRVHETPASVEDLPQNPWLSYVSSEHTHCPLLQTLLAMTHTSLSRQGPLRRPLATDNKHNATHRQLQWRTQGNCGPGDIKYIKFIFKICAKIEEKVGYQLSNTATDLCFFVSGGFTPEPPTGATPVDALIFSGLLSLINVLACFQNSRHGCATD